MRLSRSEALEQQIIELKERIARLEAYQSESQPQPPNEGWHDGRIVDVERKRSRTGNRFWSVKIELPNSWAVWMNLLEYRKSPVEEVCEKFDIAVREPFPLTRVHPMQLVGKSCKVRIVHRPYGSRTIYEVQEIRPR